MNHIFHTLSFWAVNYSEMFMVGTKVKSIMVLASMEVIISFWLGLQWKKGSVKTVFLPPTEIEMFQNN